MEGANSRGSRSSHNSVNYARERSMVRDIAAKATVMVVEAAERIREEGPRHASACREQVRGIMAEMRREER